MFWCCRFGVEFERLGTAHFALEVLESPKVPREPRAFNRKLPDYSPLVFFSFCFTCLHSHTSVSYLHVDTYLRVCFWGTKSIIYIHIQYISILWSTCLDPLHVLSVCLSINHISTYLSIHSPICLSTYLSIILNRATQCSFLKNADSWRARRERIKKSGRE